MIQSLFIITSTGQVLIERHFRGVVTERDVCTFWMNVIAGDNYTNNAAANMTTTTSSAMMTIQQPFLQQNCNPIMEVPSERQGTLYVISVRRDGLNYLAICPCEVNPLSVLELLHRLVSTFQEYFNGTADEVSIKDNFSTIYQLLEEMIDFGWPLTTELNALKVMIRPPTAMSKFLSSAAGQVGSSTTSSSGNPQLSDSQLPNGTIPNMPWRTAGVHYTNNEIYVDIVEEVDAVIDIRTGTIVSADVQGSILCQSHLSGIPDLLLTFNDATLIDDCSFHPCVRYEKFERDGVVSFVPPDGNFELMRYRIDLQKIRSIVPPIYCQAQWSSADTNHNNEKNGIKVDSAITSNATTTTNTTTQTGRLAIQVGIATLSSLVFSPSARASGKTHVEDISVQIPFPKGTRSVTDFHVNMGSVLYDEVSKIAKWNVASSMDTSTTQQATFACKFTLATNHHLVSTAILSQSTMSARRQKICSRKRRRSTTNWLLSPPNIGLGWKIPLASVSGIAVSGLSVMGESYRPYKGVRNITQAGIFQIRCGS
jgi:AP-3 complex subunit mu